MTHGGPTTISQFSVFVVSEEGHFVVSNPGLAPCGENVALYVGWSEKRGASEISTSEVWKCIAPNIWLATSQKK